MATFRKRNGKWQVQIRRAGSKGLSKSFLSKVDAQRWARKMEQEADQEGVLVDRRSLKTTTVGDLLDRYGREITPRKKAAETERGIVDGLKRRSAARTTVPRCNIGYGESGRFTLSTTAWSWTQPEPRL